MFNVEERDRLRAVLLAAAQADERIAAAAITGSGALDQEDRWSDIDLGFRIAAESHRAAVLEDWTALMYREHDAVHHLDVVRGAVLYRVFLLAGTLQVDLAFWPADEFGAIGPAFRLVFGEANDREPARRPSVAELAGLGWLYALHARSSIARGRHWQAEYMISGEREQVLALACLRHAVPPVQGRGLDLLPAAVTDRLLPSLVGSLEPATLRRAFTVVTDLLVDEIERADPELGERLHRPVRELTVF